MVRPDWNAVVRNYRTNAKYRGEIAEWSRVKRVPKETESGRVIRITSLNIRSWRERGLETVLCALKQGNIRIGVLQENKLTGGIHTRFSSGYKVWATEAESIQ